MKRSDLPTDEIIAAVRQHGFSAYEELCADYPEKVVLAAIARDVRKGLLDYGVCITRPWPTFDC